MEKMKNNSDMIMINSDMIMGIWTSNQSSNNDHGHMFLSVENILLDVQHPHRGNDCYPYKVVHLIIS